MTKQTKRLGAAFGSGVLLGAVAFGPWDWLVFTVAGLALAVNLFCAFRFDWWTWYVGTAYACGLVIGLTLAECVYYRLMPDDEHSVVTDPGFLLPIVAFIMIPWAIGRFLQYCSRPHS